MERHTMTEQHQSSLNSSDDPKPKKTYAREIACVLLASLLYFGYVGQDSTLEILVGPFTIFAVTAFGFKSEVVKEAINARGKR